MRHEWTDRTGDIGSLFTDGNNICLRLSEDLNEDEDDDADPVSVAHWLPIPTARALHEALGRALEKVDPQNTLANASAESSKAGEDKQPKVYTAQPVPSSVIAYCVGGVLTFKVPESISTATNSISATLAACSDPVPDILRKIDAACGGSQSATVVTGPDGMRVHRTLRSISTEELAKMGLKPKAHLPSDGYLLECGHWSIHKRWCTECTANIVAISQSPSQPEPPPTGNGDLVSEQYLAARAQQQAHDLDMALMEYVEAVRDVTTGSKPASRARAKELYAAIKQDMLEGDPRMSTVDRMREMMGPAPTLHPRPFHWAGKWPYDFGIVNSGVSGMTTEGLLKNDPTALEALEDPRQCEDGIPHFGRKSAHFTGPRTLREYLEAP